MVSCIVMVWSAAAAIALPAESETAPASMSSWGAVSAFTEFLSFVDRVMVSEFVPFVVMVPLDRVTPPVEELDSRMWSLEAECFEESSCSLNVTVNSPDPVLYTAEENVGFMVSCIVMVGPRRRRLHCRPNQRRRQRRCPAGGRSARSPSFCRSWTG